MTRRAGGRRVHRTALAAAALACATALPPVAAAPASPTAYGTTTFSAGAGGGVARFTLDRPTAFHLAQNLSIPEVAIEGPAGRMTGIVIAQEGISGDDGAALYAFRFNGCWDRACRTPRDDRLFPQVMAGHLRAIEDVSPTGVRTMTLPAGRYRAHVIADGAPVKVTVRFAGGRGSGRLAASGKAAQALTSAESSFRDGPVGHALYSAGATGTVTSDLGVLVGVMEARSAMHAQTVRGACHYAGTARPPHGVFAPGCPGAGPGTMIVLRSVAPIDHGLQSVTFVSGRGEWTKGLYVDGVDVREWVSPAALLWLSL